MDADMETLIENLEDTLVTYADEPDCFDVTDVVKNVILQVTDYLLKGTTR